ncbi:MULTISPECIES: NADP-dependent oxidoreductase [unclassified Leeuwenhoekiella]|uniref:NADP-dependent oxidoreductase n=1 Tax=unclassified Leeuwenhoekiella TaxID=2615029 RepID=UPI000C53347B|nr:MULTISPECIES: NADP-dependent oxidoreductase [unclassified Leeuwenhoekiella]MAW96570.1 alcohol dehydrogenase [Leeuwenhoekiella sp.]MBA81458.1 alcohol dehydrogenase [Leeuwenhoekiella sp.]|tara:strand:+ start:2770 stop:3738 length:969 start_codon:yes stop_codon:yes gene_type:complete
MKAVVINEFGGTDVLKVEEVENPVPAADEILVKVYAGGINPVDRVVREGGNAVLRPYLKLPLILGWDASGIVEEIGSKVTNFKKGDEVYGVPNFPGNGSYAEYVAAKASQFALKPQSLSYNEAAAVPLTGLVAANSIFDLGKLKAGQRIFIQGASGSVGNFAVQFAKAKGAYVIGSASTNNLEFVKQLGADEVIDYKTQHFEQLLQDIDVVFEASSVRDNKERLKSIRVLKKGGIFISANVDFPFNNAVEKAMEEKHVQGEFLAAQTNHLAWLNQFTQWFNEGRAKVTLGNVYALEQVAEAHEESEKGHVRGKFIVEVRKQS